MSRNKNRWITQGGVAMLALAGSVAFNGVTYSAEKITPAEQETPKTWAESFSVIEQWCGCAKTYLGDPRDESKSLVSTIIVNKDSFALRWKQVEPDKIAPTVDFDKYAVIEVLLPFYHDAGDQLEKEVQVAVENIFRDGFYSNGAVTIQCGLNCHATEIHTSRSDTAYGFFLVPAADAPESSNVKPELGIVKVEYETETEQADAEDVMISGWTELAKISIGSIRHPKLTDQDFAPPESREAYCMPIASSCTFRKLKDDAGDELKSLIRRYSIDERGDSADAVKSSFDADWGKILHDEVIDPYHIAPDDAGYEWVTLDFNTRDAIVIYGRCTNMMSATNYQSFGFGDIIDNDKILVFRVDPIETKAGLKGSVPFVIFNVPRGNQEIRIEVNIGEPASLGKENEKIWHLEKTISKSKK